MIKKNLFLFLIILNCISTFAAGIPDRIPKDYSQLIGSVKKVRLVEPMLGNSNGYKTVESFYNKENNLFKIVIENHYKSSILDENKIIYLKEIIDDSDLFKKYKVQMTIYSRDRINIKSCIVDEKYDLQKRLIYRYISNNYSQSDDGYISLSYFDIDYFGNNNVKSYYFYDENIIINIENSRIDTEYEQFGWVLYYSRMPNSVDYDNFGLYELNINPDGSSNFDIENYISNQLTFNFNSDYIKTEEYYLNMNFNNPYNFLNHLILEKDGTDIFIYEMDISAIKNFNEHSNIINEILLFGYDHHGGPICQEYTFDINGNELSQVASSASIDWETHQIKAIQSTNYTVQYDFDSHQNWVKKKVSDINDDGEIEISISTRSIEYYNE